MRYDYACFECGDFRECQCSVAERDQQHCPVCSGLLSRLFTPGNILIPERFRRWSARNLEPTYEEAIAIEKRNEAYLRSKPPEKPKRSFHQVLNETLVETGQKPVSFNA